MHCPWCSAAFEDGARFCPECGRPVFRGAERIGRGSVLAISGVGEALIEEPLGEGGMGVVYRAFLEYAPSGPLAGTPGHPVAVKVLRPELRGRVKSRRMFLREATALERLRHPNVVRFVALAEQGEGVAIVMEYVQGQSLSRIIQRARVERSAQGAAAAHDVERGGAGPVLPLGLAWHYLAQLLGALAAVHTIGILHRDVKAANVMVRSDDVIKLTDFGIARLPEGNPDGSGGMVVGTGAYMSPEQIRGEPLDQRCDLYAAAIALYEMLTGTTPFEREDREELEVRRAQLDEAPRAPSELATGLPPALDLVMAHALAKDRSHRYATALELGDAVRNALGQSADPLWPLQREYASLARTLSEPLPEADPALLERAERLRTAMTQPLPR